ncbi:MAG TPA: AarF/ABC1/UbiB kinase family protein [Verrucomicrobiales bacterium]|nr:AarF/ABC1/UbiB kinase family protein [Verrucomicrobiales bacterium]
MKKRLQSIARAARIVRLGSSLAGDYVARQVQRPFLSAEAQEAKLKTSRSKRARQFQEELSNLRGPVMKVGQALSMQTNALAPEWIEALSGLQMQAPPMHPSLMRAQFKSSTGKYPEEVFASFEDEPFAAASLGQVHHARTKKGADVVVKIQYPAMREVIGSDFKLLRTAGFFARLTGHLKDSVIDEAHRGIMEETDYQQEARNIEYFRKHLAPLPFLRIPAVHSEHSTDRVLVMSRVEGKRLQEFLADDPPQAVRDQLGAELTRLFFFQLFRVGALHADPHPGNYLFKSDGTIGLVDFGCVKHVKPEVIRCYAQFWSREWLHDESLYAEIIRVIFGAVKSSKAPHIRQCMKAIAGFYDEFHPLTGGSGPLDLGEPKFMDALAKMAAILLKNKFLSPEFLFLSRTEAGLCNILHILKARVPTTKIAKEFVVW